MRTILLILHLMSFAPPMGPQPQDPVPAKAKATGTATIVIASCVPGDTVTVGPGNYRSYVTEDGTVIFKVPAQNDDEDPYLVQDRRGTHALNGTAAAGQMLTGVCL